MTQQSLLELTTQGNTNNFENIYHEVLETAKIMKLTFGSAEFIERQITKISVAQTKLIHTKKDLESLIKKQAMVLQKLIQFVLLKQL